MRILVACEYSGRVRDAFIRAGHDAVSCDILPSESDFGPHLRVDVRALLNRQWDMVIAFPPCTHLAASGARWWAEKRASGQQQEAVDFFMAITNANAPRIAIENPVGFMSTAWRKPDQIIHPWEHGHGEQKKTCLWLKGLPLLQPSHVVDGREQRIWKMPGGPNQAKKRSLTYMGIAQAMADQWGKLLAPVEALTRIRDARDQHAETGEYPEYPLGPDEFQAFDDWAADVADLGLPASLDWGVKK